MLIFTLFLIGFAKAFILVLIFTIVNDYINVNAILDFIFLNFIQISPFY